MDKYHFQVRVTGVLMEDGKLLLVRQPVDAVRIWSLPGGRAEAGERLDTAVVREMREETGLLTKITKLLYVCDKTDSEPPILHITFLLERIGGALSLPSNAFDENPISDVRFVPISELIVFGFSQRFVDLALQGFPGAGEYMGLKENIGL